MRHLMVRGFRSVSILLVCMLLFSGTALAAEKIGVFQEVLEADGNFDAATAALEKSIADSSLELIGKMDVAVPKSAQKCRTYLLTSAPYIDAANENNISSDAVSALILKIGVYEAQGKVHINMANLEALGNVYFDGEKKQDALLEAAAEAKKEMIQVIQGVPGKIVNAQQAPMRKVKSYRGYNGDGPAKMMAKWRNFRKSLLTAKVEDKSKSLDTIIDEIKKNAAKTLKADPAKGWKVVAIKKVNENAAWVGITNNYTETKCVNINSDFRFGDKSENTKYPGVDHAPAFPMEIVIHKGKKGEWNIAHYGQMWRMQLYFWDSGYAAFAKNTIVPSIIFGNIEDMLEGK